MSRMQPKIRVPKRRLGLTKETYPYGHLLEKLPSSAKEERLSLPEPAWDAPPIDTSDESTSALSDATRSSHLSESELPVAKKAPYSGFRVPTIGSARLSDDDDVPDGHIKPTTFTSREESTKQNGCGPGQKRSREEMDEEETDKIMFGMLGSSQSSQGKRLQTYSIKNLHASAPSPKQKKGGLKARSSAMKEANGFKIPDTDAILAEGLNPKVLSIAFADLPIVDKLSSKKIKNDFVQPPQLPNIKRSSAGTRRSSRNKHDRDTPAIEFQAPPAVPPRICDNPGNKKKLSFVAPAGVPRRPSMEPPSFRVPAGNIQHSDLSNQIDNSSSKETSKHLSASCSVSSTSTLSSPPSSPILIASSHDLDLSFLSTITPPSSAPILPTLCPVCQEPVPSSDLAAFTAEYTRSHRLTVRQQAYFCRLHRTATAQAIWKARGYPDIDWKKMPDRLAAHDVYITSIIKNTQPSYYRSLLTQKVASGINRTAAQAFARADEDGGAETGYYGSKGEAIITDYIVQKYGKLARKLAGGDKVVAAGGEVSGFVQKVLLPEVVCRLVMEDMGLRSEEEARAVCAEGAELGELLNEHADDLGEARRKDGERGNSKDGASADEDGGVGDGHVRRVEDEEVTAYGE
ncbi:hypothetical protein MMC34_003900 [Xylographa carneopallida]|nr:hypothetical protein [Xylographa carneopallida]